MTVTLLLVGGASADQPLHWLTIDAQGGVRARGQASSAQSLPRGEWQRCALVLPGADARVFVAELPARTQAQARAGAEAMLSARLAERGRTPHYAVGEPFEGGRRIVAAIARERLELWLDRCRALGVTPELAALDCLVLSCAAGEVVIVDDGVRAIVGGSGVGGFSIESDLAPSVFLRWVKEAREHVSRISLHAQNPALWRGALSETSAPSSIQPAPDVLALLAAGVARASDTTPNLLQGIDAVAQRARPAAHLWRFAALLAVAAVLLQVGSLAIAGWRDNQAASRIETAAERDYRAARPDLAARADIHSLVSAQMRRIGQGARHPVLTVTGPVVAALRAQPAVRLEELHYQAPGRAVRMRLSSSDAAALQAAIASLRTEGFNLESSDMLPQEGRYAAELTIEAPA